MGRKPHSRAMSAQNAKDKADEIVAHLVKTFGISVADKGRKFQLVSFGSEDQCRFFYPQRALKFHQQITTYISRSLRARFGLKIQRIEISIDDYHLSARQRPAVIISQDASPPTFHARDYAEGGMKFLEERGTAAA